MAGSNDLGMDIHGFRPNVQTIANKKRVCLCYSLQPQPLSPEKLWHHALGGFGH